MVLFTNRVDTYVELFSLEKFGDNLGMTSSMDESLGKLYWSGASPSSWALLATIKVRFPLVNALQVGSEFYMDDITLCSRWIRLVVVNFRFSNLKLLIYATGFMLTYIAFPRIESRL